MIKILSRKEKEMIKECSIKQDTGGNFTIPAYMQNRCTPVCHLCGRSILIIENYHMLLCGDCIRKQVESIIDRLPDNDKRMLRLYIKILKEGKR